MRGANREAFEYYWHEMKVDIGKFPPFERKIGYDLMEMLELAINIIDKTQEYDPELASFRAKEFDKMCTRAIASGIRGIPLYIIEMAQTVKECKR